MDSVTLPQLSNLAAKSRLIQCRDLQHHKNEYSSEKGSSGTLNTSAGVSLLQGMDRSEDNCIELKKGGKAEENRVIERGEGFRYV